jgi:hypothetical protein
MRGFCFALIRPSCRSKVPAVGKTLNLPVMKIAVTVLLLSFCFSSCSQTKKLQMGKSYGFFQKFTPGIIPREGMGNRQRSYPDTLYAIYVETKGPAPDWQKAWTKTNSYLVRILPANDSLVFVGEKKGSGEKVQLKPSKEYSFQRLQLVKERETTRAPKSVGENSVLLQGSFGSKPFYYTVSSFTELQAPLYQ